MRRCLVVLALAVGACTHAAGPGPAHGGAPPRRADGQLSVVLEGACEGLRVSVVGADVFAHTGGGGLVRLTGAAPQLLPSLPGMQRFDDLVGRWPDALYATTRSAASGPPDRVMRFTGDGWLVAPGLTNGETIRELVPRPGGGLVVRVLTRAADGHHEALRVIDAQGPALDLAAVDRSCTAPAEVTRIAGDARGDFMATWRCDGATFAGHWSPGAATPRVHRLPADTPASPFRVVPDRRGGFWLAYNREARLLFVDADGWRALVVPGRRGWIDTFERGPDGRPWLRRGGTAWRADPDGWRRERLPGFGSIEAITGVAEGEPWIRRGGTFYLHGHQLRATGRVHARGRDGRWHRVAPPPSTLAPDRRLSIDFLQTDAGGGIWALAHATQPRVRADGSRVDHLAILTDRDVAAIVRCSDDRGELDIHGAQRLTGPHRRGDVRAAAMR